MKRTRNWLWLLWPMLGMAAASHAEDALKGVGDPTRPPAGVVARGADGSTAGQGAGAPPPAAAASGASAPESSKPKVALVLQSIRYELYTGRAVAMINDELVSVGDKVADMRVISITRETAVLKGPSGVRRLSLLIDEEEAVPSKAVSVASDKGEAAKSGRKESK